jgi:predicted nucleic acid-binding protein
VTGDGEPRNVLLDASVLINLANLNRLSLLGALEERFFVPESVIDEIRRETQRRRLKKALQAGFLQRMDPEDSASLHLFSRLLRDGLGAGEAACLALAATRDWVVATDDRRARREARKQGVGHLGTPGLLLLAIRRDLLSVEEADAAIEILEKHRFRVAFDSFAELL